MPSPRACCCAGSSTGWGPTSRSTSSRRELVRRLIELQLLRRREMESPDPGSPTHELVARRSKDWLADVRAALRSLATGALGRPAAPGNGDRGAAWRPGMAQHARRPARSRDASPGDGVARRRASSSAAAGLGLPRAAIPTRATLRSATAASGCRPSCWSGASRASWRARPSDRVPRPSGRSDST